MKSTAYIARTPFCPIVSTPLFISFIVRNTMIPATARKTIAVIALTMIFPFILFITDTANIQNDINTTKKELVRC
jgi:hypothetical protein